MNSHGLPRETVERLYRLSRAAEFPALLDVLSAEAASATKRALASADPKLCGAACALRDALAWLEGIPAEFEARRDRGD
ncbi:MAG TPA: hypothetical protein PLP22_00295 [Candidatus Competibacter sp.]|nr:hypothetical protein [Candidatus Competibacteraceae bacterium]HRE53209.1 hypothetical protein [Candidatus Competibacter sp.]HUM95719.1 hypothetical protein [Candidatus Competibacter sp.]